MNSETAGDLILVVEHERTTRMVTRSMLERQGYRVIEAGNGADAVSQFRFHEPALVLLDVEMPILNGFEACRRIREMVTGGDVPIVMMTGLSDTAKVDEAFRVGATDFIPKPVNWSILGHRLRYILRNHRILRDLKFSEARLSNAQRIARLGYWEWNLVSRELQWSPTMYVMFEVSPESFQVSCDAFIELIHPADREIFREKLERAQAGQAISNFEHRMLLPRGGELNVVEHIELTRDVGGHSLSLTATLQDISERKRTEEQVQFLAYHDQLTSLPNRELFKDRVTQAISRARREGLKLALLFVDLDRFKNVNDTLGHKLGDTLLELVAERLRALVRETDLVAQGQPGEEGQLARLGGDEFTVLLPVVRSREDAARVGDRIVEVLSRPYDLDSREIVVTASVGIACYPEDGSDVDALIKNADAAMYDVKDSGRNGFRYYLPEMTQRTETRLKLENDLRKALRNHEFELHYQPQIDLSDQRMVGVEALVRWRHPERGLISPGEFIPVAEDSGLIIPLGQWVLEEACRQNRTWQLEGLPPVRMSVNVAAQQFQHDDFLVTVRRALADSGLSADSLELEVTENALINTDHDVMFKLKQIRNLGISLAVDDFGTGFSSLSFIKQFPLTTLKVDRSFVTDIGQKKDEAIVKIIIHLAHELNLLVISEGVETQRQLDFLRLQGSNMAQGFLFSRPLLPNELRKLLLQPQPLIIGATR
ncbi:MAG: EAL domain-containing protein [Thiotrichales bacterium]